MSLIAGINLVMGLAGGLAQNRAASNAARMAQKERNDALNSARADDAARMKWYQDQVASGNYNPDSQIALARETSGHELRKGVGNLQGGLLGKGYAPGSSNIEQGSRTLSEGARLKLAGMEQGIRQGVRSEQMGAMNFASPRSNSMILNQSNIDRSRSDQMGWNPSGLLSSAMGDNKLFDFLKARSSDKTPKPYQFI